MREKREVVVYCLTLGNVYEDYPFHDDKWCVMRHKASKKTFAYIYEKNDQIWVNVKCEPQWRDFWRSTFEAVVPGYHMNKEHWNSIILDGTIPKRDIKRMIAESYDLTKGKRRGKQQDGLEPAVFCVFHTLVYLYVKVGLFFIRADIKTS